MQILEISKGNTKPIIVNGQDVFQRMDNFFKTQPKSYREIYDKNLKDLLIYHVDQINGSTAYGEYHDEDNTIYIAKPSAITHELIHCATNNQESGLFAFCGNYICLEIPLIEGMSEYFATIINESNMPNNYYFETFVARMISKIDGVNAAFFEAQGHQEFLKLFPGYQKMRIYSLQYALNHYSQNHFQSLENDKIDNKIIKDIQHILKTLLSIEINYEKDPQILNTYYEEFFDILSSDYLSFYLGELYPKYKDYAYQMTAQSKTKKRKY